MEASDGGHLDTVRVLLHAKADPNITNEVKLQATKCTISNLIDALLYYRMVKLLSFLLPEMITLK